MQGIRFAIAAFGFAATLSAVTIGHVDTFSDGTTMGWFIPAGGANAPANISTGGPGGVDDAYLQLTATGGGGPGSRLSVLSGPQWAGNYLSAGVGLIRMDVNNFGPDELYLRLLFEAFPAAGGPPTDVALTANAVRVAAGSGWQTIQFAVGVADLISAGLGTPAGALADVDVVRIFHNPDPTFSGPGVGPPPVVATLGVDNITAVPEPAAWWLMAAGGSVVAVIRRRQAPR